MKKTKLKWFLPLRFTHPEDLENYYEEMDAKGWHKEKISQINSICTKFRRTDPKKNRYVVDLNPNSKTGDYVSTHQSSGWELVGKMSSMFIWRKAYQDNRPETFTDSITIKNKNKAFSNKIIILQLFSLILISIISILFIVFKKELKLGLIITLLVVQVITVFWLLVLMISRLNMIKHKVNN